MTSEFIGITESRLMELRDGDRVVRAIQSRSAPVSFHWLRESFKRDHDLKSTLDYGRAILGEVSQLDQYLYTYGKMIQAQWQSVLSECVASGELVRLIDYGCGQGLAAVIVSDCLGTTFTSKVEEAILIEPSEVALTRAEAVYRNLFGNYILE